MVWLDVWRCLASLENSLKNWKREVSGNLNHRKKTVAARLVGIQIAADYHTNRFLQNLEVTLTQELGDILAQEEILWFQKSRSEWVQFGGRNTCYFHTRAVVRRCALRIDALKDANGNWVSGRGHIQSMLISHFRRFYMGPRPIDRLQLGNFFPSVEANFIQQLDRPVSMEKIKNALGGTGPFKSPRPDGFQAFFDQTNWDVVGSAVYQFVQWLMDEGESVKDVNHTFIVLIPKIVQPETVKQFRPISLCNVTYKVVTKVIANRLRNFLPDVVGPNQPNRL